MIRIFFIQFFPSRRFHLHGYRQIFSYVFSTEFEIWGFRFIYLPLFDLFVLTFGFSLCRLFLDYKGSVDVCMDSIIIYGQPNELQSRKLCNILYILGNIWYPIQFIYIWHAICIFFRILTSNWNVSMQDFTHVFYDITSWMHSSMKFWFDILEYLQYLIYYYTHNM